VFVDARMQYRGANLDAASMRGCSVCARSAAFALACSGLPSTTPRALAAARAPQAYFADVLSRLVNLWPASRLDDLMP